MLHPQSCQLLKRDGIYPIKEPEQRIKFIHSFIDSSRALKFLLPGVTFNLVFWLIFCFDFIWPLGCCFYQKRVCSFRCLNFLRGFHLGTTFHLALIGFCLTQTQAGFTNKEIIAGIYFLLVHDQAFCFSFNPKIKTFSGSLSPNCSDCSNCRMSHNCFVPQFPWTDPGPSAIKNYIFSPNISTLPQLHPPCRPIWLGNGLGKLD